MKKVQSAKTIFKSRVNISNEKQVIGWGRSVGIFSQVYLHFEIDLALEKR